MALTPEQVKELKKQLSEQIKHLPEDKRKEAQKQIDNMSSEALESMLKQQQAKQSQKPIFRSIVSGEIPSKILDTNKDAIAVLDIKPISKGHTIIIPKKPITNSKGLPTSAFALAKKIAKKIASKLKSSSCEIQTESKFEEIIINVIPIYDQPLNINSPRQDISSEDLEKIYDKLKTPDKSKIIKIRKRKQLKIIKLKRKIP